MESARKIGNTVEDFSSDAARWAAVQAGLAAAEGHFWTAVRTTGIYCQPSCPARLPHRANITFYDSREAAERAGYRPCKRCRPDQGPEAKRQRARRPHGIGERVAALDWARITGEIDDRGYGLTGPLLTKAECGTLAAGYDDGALYRSTVVMKRHGFGSGEYRYFGYPLPDLIEGLRQAAYPRLAPLANRWMEVTGQPQRFPAELADFLDACHAAGQVRPTPLILRYGTGDYNCLHQDLYGDLAFPLQLAVLLDRPGTDFDGGEFVLTEQRPRMQSRAEVVPLARGEAVIFAVNERPVQGGRGPYRVKLRHGVSRLRRGQRHTLGIIFHDAD